MKNKVDLFEKAEIIHHELFEYEDIDGKSYLYNPESQEFLILDEIKGFLSINIRNNLKKEILKKYREINPVEDLNAN